MNYKSIETLQKLYGIDRTQELINSGDIWHFEGSVGRHAMDLLRAGLCLLPLTPSYDYYGNRIPSRKEVKPGTAGSYQNCLDYWQAVSDGDIDAVEALELI